MFKTKTKRNIRTNKLYEIDVGAHEEMLDAWEKKVLNKLNELRKLWEIYKRKHLSTQELRARGTKEAIDEAIQIEIFKENIESLFAEAKNELEAEIRARLRGEEHNMVVASRRVSEALDALEIYAKTWRKEVTKA